MSSVADENVSNTAAAAEEDTSSLPPKKSQNWWLLFLYCLLSVIGSVSSPSLLRLYFMHGGTHKWLATWFLSIGCFLSLPILAFLYLKTGHTFKHFIMDLRLFLGTAVIGILIGLQNFWYSVGLSYLPLSTATLLLSTQLAFTAVFAFLIVKQKFTFTTINSVLLITFGAVVLGISSNGDRPPGVTKQKYLVGFLLTLGGAACWGLTSPLIELAYKKSRKAVNYVILLQVLFNMNLFASLFCTVGMLIHKDFQAIAKEAREFSLGPKKYYIILVSGAVVNQLTFLGIAGMISCATSLFVGIFNSGLLPLTEVAAVIIFKEKFTGAKGLSLAISLWGFASYFYGEHKKNVNKNVKTKPIGENPEKDGDREPVVDLESPNQIEMTGSRRKSDVTGSRRSDKFEIQEVRSLSERI